MAWPLLALLAGSTALQGISGALDASGNRRLTEEEMRQRERLATQGVATQESLANPFRHQAAQAATAAALDRMERGTYKPVQVQAAGPYAQYVPKTSGGFSYEKSPELINASGALKRNVLAGKTAPTMTDPLNYGRTGALALDAQGNPMPGTQGGNAPFAPAAEEFLSKSYEPTTSGARDYAVADARAAVAKAIKLYQHRDAGPGEIDAILRSQGWKPGDRWVGQAGLVSVINTLAPRTTPVNG
jgi:hypothetical protein